LLQFQRAGPSTALDKGIYFIEGEYSGLTAVVKKVLTMLLCYCILLLSIFINHSSAKAVCRGDAMTTSMVTIPNIQLTLDQVLIAVRQLEPDGRQKVAQLLLTEAMDEKFQKLIARLAETPPVTDMSDDDINAEIRAVRAARRQRV
jgi:hypothetical protein